MVITNDAMYIINAAKNIEQKHRLPLNRISLLVTDAKDKVLLVRLPEDLYKKDKVGKHLILIAFEIDVNISRALGRPYCRGTTFNRSMHKNN